MIPKSKTVSRLRGYRLVSRMQLLALALCLLASATVVSCGSSDGRPQTTVSAAAVDGPRNLVSPSEIADAGASTPQAAVLKWFQAVQYRDYTTALERMTASVRQRVGPNALRNAISVVGPALGKPEITGVFAHGTAAVSVHIVVLAFSPNSAKAASEVPITLPLVKGPSGWQVDDATYLLESAHAMDALVHPPQHGAP